MILIICLKNIFLDITLIRLIKLFKFCFKINRIINKLLNTSFYTSRYSDKNNCMSGDFKEHRRLDNFTGASAQNFI